MLASTLMNNNVYINEYIELVVNIFIKNIDKSVSHKQFHDYYSQFGNIVSLKIAEDDEGESLGYGFVLYESLDYFI